MCVITIYVFNFLSLLHLVSLECVVLLSFSYLQMMILVKLIFGDIFKGWDKWKVNGK